MSPDAGRSSELRASGRPRKKRIRSITGCSLCRRRRVKCDEKRPQCTNCSRHPLRVCEYEFDFVSNDDLLGMPGQSNNTSTIASSSSLTLDALQCIAPMVQVRNTATDTFPGGDRPIPRRYEELVSGEIASKALNAELLARDMFNTTGSGNGMALAEAFIARLPVSSLTEFGSLLSFHYDLVRKCFSHLQDDPQAKLLCTATAIISARTEVTFPSRREELFGSYVDQLKTKTDNVITGKLAGVGFTLLLWDLLDPSPAVWRERLDITKDWNVNRGGPGYALGVGPPIPGYKGGEIAQRQPLLMGFYMELTAMIELYACLTDGSMPLLLLLDRRPWLLALRGVQVTTSAKIPDTIEVIFGVPRILIPTFAQVVALVSRRTSSENQSSVMQEQLEFEASSLRAELEHVWPGRLDGRRDSRRLQYGARLLRLALVTFLMQKVQLFSTNSPELKRNVEAFYELCLEATSVIGHLSGWLWPILLAACAAQDESIREGFRNILPLAKSPVGDRDNSETAKHMLFWIWLHRDLGDEGYHMKEAVRDVPSLNVLLL